MRTPTIERDLTHMVQRVFKFANGYTASVIRGKFSYGGRDGLWELAVMHDGHIVYDTPITDDVLGWLTDDAVDEVLAKVEALPAREVA